MNYNYVLNHLLNVDKYIQFIYDKIKSIFLIKLLLKLNIKTTKLITL